MSQLAQDQFNKLFATDTVSGPADLADLARLLHAGGMSAAGWLIDSHLDTVEELSAEIELCEDYTSPEDVEATEKAHAASVAELEERIEDLERECNTLTEVTDGAAEILELNAQLTSARETINAQAQRIREFEQAAKVKRKRATVPA